MFRPRSLPGRLAFALLALLAGCSTAQQPPVISSWDSAALGGSVMLLRILPAEGGPAAWAQAWRFDGPTAPDEFPLLADGGGWRSAASVPGRRFLRLRASPDATPQDFTFTVPDGQATLDLGTFRQVCNSTAECRLVREARPASDAEAALPPQHRERLPVVVTPMQSYPPRLADSGLALPTAPAIRVDSRSWVAAVDWTAIVTDLEAMPSPPAGPFTSAGDDVLLAIMLLPIIVPLLVIVAIAKSESERRAGVEAAEARSRDLALQARVEAARAAWSPCEATIAAALAPDSVAQHLQSAFARPRAGRQAAASPWDATVSRVVLRHCGEGPGSFGVEVATDWTGRAPGSDSPAYRASFVRPVEGATPDRRLRWSTPAPWEMQVAPSGACRPLAEWCAAGGRALLDEVAAAVTGARDAIAATR
ncbi:hypothetical protein DFH01_05630 [Falsiroseomonas bella]|uniref:Uncharacterized protein n=2 Tax=Falsiroseomonas bella TaxID=2184016 RepID=A0A317FMJ2_9PROT|nr:hypothetical protein DFH01_05630 [Falsiroseomonas bella]